MKLSELCTSVHQLSEPSVRARNLQSCNSRTSVHIHTYFCTTVWQVSGDDEYVVGTGRHCLARPALTCTSGGDWKHKNTRNELWPNANSLSLEMLQHCRCWAQHTVKLAKDWPNNSNYYPNSWVNTSGQSSIHSRVTSSTGEKEGWEEKEIVKRLTCCFLERESIKLSRDRCK